MRNKKIFKELFKDNKEAIEKDFKELEKIEMKIEDKISKKVTPS